MFHSGEWLVGRVDQARIAKLAGCSQSTVSAALSGKPGVSQTTREAIQSLARELSYEPSYPARALVTGAMRAVGFLTSLRLQRQEWAYSVQAGILQELQLNGNHLVLFNEGPQAEKLPILKHGRVVDAVIVALGCGKSLLERLEQRGIPMAYVDPATEDVGHDSVRSDDEQGGKLAAQHLIELGHRRIAFLGGAMKHIGLMQSRRWKGYVDAMGEAGLPIIPGGDKTVSSDGSADFLERRLEQLFSHAHSRGHRCGDAPTALIAISDPVAVWTISWLKRHDLDVPREVSVIGFDDDAYPALMSPALSTIRVPYFEIGMTAASLVLERIENPDVETRQVVLPETLVARETTGPPADNTRRRSSQKNGMAGRELAHSRP